MGPMLHIAGLDRLSHYSLERLASMGMSHGVRQHNFSDYYVRVVRRLVEQYPDACWTRNKDGKLPLELMEQSGKHWDTGMKEVLLPHPGGVADIDLNTAGKCRLLYKVGQEGATALFSLLRSGPSLVTGGNVM
jgi:hypothetical protein